MIARRGHPGFSLVELLAAMALVVLLAGAGLVAFRAAARGARLALARNTITAALAEARTRALTDGRHVLVAVRAAPAGGATVGLAAWAGESYRVPGAGVVDRFVPVPGAPTRRLPAGTAAAAPLFAANLDEVWVATSDLPAVRRGRERPGAVIAVMFAPDGTMATQNPRTDSNRIFVDFDASGTQRQGGRDHPNVDGPGPHDHPDNTGRYCRLGGDAAMVTQFLCQADAEDEPYVTMAPYLAVFETTPAPAGGDPDARARARSAGIARRADRIHFNRYTGVAM